MEGQYFCNNNSYNNNNNNNNVLIYYNIQMKIASSFSRYMRTLDVVSCVTVKKDVLRATKKVDSQMN